MTCPIRVRAARDLPRRGVSLVEVIISIVIVAVMFTAALTSAGGALTVESKTAERHRALLLAQDLAAEILQYPYKEPGT